MKKKIFFCFIISFLLINTAYSQSGWYQQQSGTTVKLNKVFFITPQTGWIVGDSGKILKTTNEGANWFSQSSSTNHTLVSVQFLNENTGYIIGGDAHLFTFSFIKILKTTNGGANWILVYDSADLASWVTDICFVNVNTGFASCGGGNGGTTEGIILKTTNGGANWDRTSSYIDYHSIQFTNAFTGYITASSWSDISGDTSLVLKTTNAGVNWNAVFSKPYSDLSSTSFLNNNTGWAAGRGNNGDMILKTTNGGNNWQVFLSSPVTFIKSIFFSSYDTGWYCGNKVFNSTNSGTNWLNQVPGGSVEYNSIYFINNSTGWTVGTNGIILKTISGGITALTSNFENIPDNYFLAQNYPNPFNPVTNLEFGISESGFVSLKVYDMLGKEIATLVNGNLNPGTYKYNFDASGLSSGIFFYKLQTERFAETKKMLLIF